MPEASPGSTSEPGNQLTIANLKPAQPLEILRELASQGTVLAEDIKSEGQQLPRVLLIEPKSKKAQLPPLFDFRYFSDSDQFEQSLEDDAQASSWDEQIRRAHGSYFEKLYRLYEALVALRAGLQQFLQQLLAGQFLHYSLDTMLLSNDGKKLLLEAIYSLGSAMLTLAHHIPDLPRERSVVAFFRLKGGTQAVGPSINAVMKLCAATGSNPSAKQPPAGFPESFLARFPLEQQPVLQLLNNLRQDDLYSALQHFPNPEHRSVALSRQAVRVYITLYYCPKLLHRDAPLMRSLVDRHFADCWVIPFSQGRLADLAAEWEAFGAAKATLLGTLVPGRVKLLAASHADMAVGLQKQLQDYLVEGQLKEEYVLEHNAELLDCLRSCNVTLRWLLLHASTNHRKLRPVVAAAAAEPPDALLGLLLDTALMENRVRRIAGRLLGSKQERWEAQKQVVASSLTRLATFFLALKAASAVRGTHLDASPGSDGSRLSVWFDELTQQVEGMDLDDGAGSNRRVQQLNAALDDVERFHPAEAAAQTKAYLAEIRGHLARLLRLADLQPELLHALDHVAAGAWAWAPLQSHTARLQAMVRDDPSNVAKVLCLADKLRQGEEAPLLLLEQAGSPDLARIAACSHARLLSFTQRLLQGVPAAVFEALEAAAQLRREHDLELPARVERDQLRDYALLPQRAHLLRLTSRMAAFANGLLGPTLFSPVANGGDSLPGLEPHKLLTEGIRSHLAQRLAQVLTSALAFPGQPVALPYDRSGAAHAPLLAVAFGRSPTAELIAAGQELSRKLRGLCAWSASLRSSLECSQHVLGIQARPMWNAEIENLTHTAMALELKAFQADNKASQGSGSAKQALNPPSTWLGAVASELLRIADPQLLQHSSQQMAWVDATGRQAAPLHLLQTLHDSLGTPAMGALHKLLGRRICSAAAAAVQLCRAELSSGLCGHVANLGEVLQDPLAGTDGAPAVLAEMTKRGSRLWPRLEAALAAAGQAAPLQSHIAHQMRLHARVSCAGSLTSPLETLQQARALSLAAAAQPGSSAQPPLSIASGMPQHGRRNQQLALAVRQPRGQAGTQSLAAIGNSSMATAATDWTQGHEASGLDAWLRLAGLSDSRGLDKPAPGAEDGRQLPEELPLLMLLLLHNLLPDCMYSQANAAVQLSSKPSRHADLQSLLHGIVLMLSSSGNLQRLLEHLGESIHAHIQAATSMAAHGAQAAGIEVTMPPEVSLLVGLAEAIIAKACLPHSHLHKFISPFICASAHTVFADRVL
ncbi:hypothetical protein WJX74_009419 [Apatococcus lobatus]|uniref:Uncharacterized protein n=1 Tax=Apatococcus lobatus TaxID=904363 RepID=A0AAW1QDM4_9CHLO